MVTLSRRKVPFVLVGSKASKPSEVYMHVELDDPPKHPLPLVTVYHKLHPVPASSYTFFQTLFGRRYPVGLLDEEKILPVGQEVTAVGLIRAFADGDPIIFSSQHLPCFLNWIKYKARQRERLRREEDRRQDSVPVEYESEHLTEVPDGELCIRVEQRPNPRCPVCRQEVNGYVRVYDS
ncbi:hypothetical protein R1sor_023209 [Riccia sorocarpa]|uniref:RING-type E3 ubiquitin transferase n=1 Tax=Riccia sorocarpa TaxID=122646 RepID=A0ABD3GM01_9MARC